MKSYQYRALSSRVLVVAVFDENIKDWSAYIDAVPGMNHDHEFQEVARAGEKIDIRIARILFPDIAENYKWRD